MKKYLLAVLVACSLVSGCRSETEYGKCVGLGDEQDPALHYKPSVRNLIVGIVFIELIAPPVIVGINEFYCPVGKK